MRLPWIALALALPALCSRASGDVAPQGAAPIRLPLTFIQSNPVTTLSVGGRTIQAIVDTSAGDADGALTLSHDVIESAGGILLGNAVMNDERGRRLLRPRFRIPVVIVDGRTFRDINAVEALPAADEQSPVPNVIGKDFLSRYFVVVDFAAANVSLWPPGIDEPMGVDCGRARIPMARTTEPGLAVGVFKGPAGRVRLGWSTSSGYSLLTETAARKMKLATVTHGPDSPGFFRFETLSAAGRDFGPREFVVLPVQLPAGVDGMLGRDFFERHVVCLDYRRREVRVR